MSDNNDMTLPIPLVMGVVELLAQLPYEQCYEIIHTISKMVHEAQESQEPKIITGATP